MLSCPQGWAVHVWITSIIRTLSAYPSSLQDKLPVQPRTVTCRHTPMELLAYNTWRKDDRKAPARICSKVFTSARIQIMRSVKSLHCANYSQHISPDLKAQKQCEQCATRGQQCNMLKTGRFHTVPDKWGPQWASRKPHSRSQIPKAWAAVGLRTPQWTPGVIKNPSGMTKQQISYLSCNCSFVLTADTVMSTFTAPVPTVTYWTSFVLTPALA